MFKKARAIATFGVLGVVLTIASNGGRAQAANPPADVAQALTEIATRLDGGGRAGNVPHLADLRVDIKTNTIDVYGSDDSASVLSQVRALAGAVNVRFHKVPLDEDALNAIMDRVSAQRLALKGAGVTVNSVRKDAVSGTVVVGVSDPATAGSELRRRFGDQVSVEQAEPVESTGTRIKDSSPWYAGSFLFRPDSGENCTSGFTAKNPAGAQYLVTARHCFPLTTSSSGSVIQNGSSIIGQYNSNIGNVVSLATPASHLDAELIKPASNSTGNAAFVGSALNDSVVNYQYTYGYRVSTGMLICTDGAYEGQNCGIEVFSNDICVTYTDGNYFCHLARAQKLGAQINGGGDSGGPVYTVNSSGLTLRGTISGGTNTAKCTRYNPRGTRPCYDTVYFTNIGYILDHFGVTMR
jgi:hypothetical protein